MSIFSQNYPSSNRVLIGSSCAFTIPRSIYWPQDSDSRFQGPYTASVGTSEWAEEDNTGVTIDDTSGLSIASAAPASLTLNNVRIPQDLNSASHLTLSTSVGNLDLLSTGESVSITLGYVSGSKDVSVKVQIIKLLEGFECKMVQNSDSAGFGSYQHQLSDVVSITEDVAKISISILNRPDVNMLVGLVTINGAISLTTGSIMTAEFHSQAADLGALYDLYTKVDTDADVTIKLVSLIDNPILTSDSPTFLPYCTTSSQGLCYFRDVARYLYSGAIIAQQLMISGSGSAYGTSDPQLLDIEFEPEVPSLNPSFATSLCDVPRTNIETCSVCPLEATPADTNRGAQVLTNICFCDGSAANTEAVEVGIDLKGSPQRYRSEIGQKDMGFFIKDGEMYQDRNLKRIHAPDIAIGSASQVYTDVRCLPLSSGARIYYGLRIDESIGASIFPKLTYNFSELQTAAGLGPLDAVLDEFYWELLDEDGTSIQQPFAGVIDKDNYLDVANVPVFETLDPGRYKLRLRVISGFFTQGATGYDRGATLYGAIHSGTTDADPLLASGFAKGYNILGLDPGDKRQQGWHDVHFEISYPFSAITIWYYDPCDDSLTEIEDPSDLAIPAGRSLAAVEQSDGTVAIYFKELTGNGLYLDSMDRKIGVRIFDIQTRAFTGTSTLYISGEGYGLNCFDVVSLGDETIFYLSMFDDLSDPATLGTEDSIFVTDLESGYPASPLSQKYGLIRIKLKDLVLSDGLLGTIALSQSEPLSMTVMEEYLSLEYAEVFVDDNVGHETKLFQPASIRANSDGDRIILSMIDLNTRFPVISIDSTNSQPVVVAVPNFFDMFNQFKSMQRPEYIEINRSPAYANIESLDCVMGYDNMLYAFATRGQLVEMSVLDPSPYFEDAIIYRKTFVNDSLEVFERYRPRFAPENYTIISKGIDEDPYFPYHISAAQQMNYTVVTLAAPEFGTPFIYQSGAPAQNPNMCSLEMDWLPELGSYEDWIVLNGVLDAGRMALQNLLSGGSSVSLTLDDTTVLRHNHLYMDRGYKFYARMSFSGLLTDPAYFTCYGIVDGDPTYRRADCRWVLMGTTAEAQYYDYDAASWVSVETWALAEGRVYDFYIYIRNTGPNRNIATFQISEVDHCNNLHSMDFREYTVARAFRSSVIGTSFEAVEEGGVSVLYPSNGSSDLPEYVYLHHLGWGFLKYWEGNFTEEIGSKGGSPFLFFTPSTPNSRNGRSSSFDDTPVLASNQAKGTYLYKPRATTSQSARFHWYNGFSMAFLSYDAGWKNDSFTLMREEASSVSSISKLKLHGLFSAPATLDPTYVFFDAEDAGLDVIYANTMLMKDQNFRDCYIVGRQDELDDWTQIGIASSDEVVLSGEFGTVSDGKGCFYVDGEISTNSLISFNSISAERWISTSEKCFKVTDIDLSAGSIYFDLGEETAAPSTFVGSVSLFSGEPLCKRFPTQGWRYFGIMIPAQPTASTSISLGTLDIAYRSSVPAEFGASDGTALNRTAKFNTLNMFEHQPQASVWQIDAKTISLSYSLVDAESALMLSSLVEDSSMNRRAIWVCYDGLDRSCNLMLISGSPVLSYIKGNGNEESYYTISISLNGVD